MVVQRNHVGEIVGSATGLEFPVMQRPTVSEWDAAPLAQSI